MKINYSGLPDKKPPIQGGIDYSGLPDAGQGIDYSALPDTHENGYIESALRTGAAVLAGIPASVTSGYIGAYDFAKNLYEGKNVDTALASANNAIGLAGETTANTFLQTEGERKASDTIGKVLMYLPEKVGELAGSGVEALGGGPNLQAGANTAAQLAVMLAGGKTAKSVAVKTADTISARRMGKTYTEAINKAESLPARTPEEVAIKAEAIKAAGAIPEKVAQDVTPRVAPPIGEAKKIDEPTPIETPESQKISEVESIRASESQIAPESQVISETPTVTPKPTKPVVTTSDGTTTGVKNSITFQERGLRGLPEVERDARKALGEIYDNGKTAVEQGKIDPRALARELSQKPRPATSEEIGALAHDRMRLKIEIRETYRELEKAIEAQDPVLEESIRGRLERAEKDFDFNDEACAKTGTQQSEAFEARKMIVREDYTIEEIIRRAKVDLGVKELPPDVKAKYEKLANDIEKANNRIAILEEQNSKLESVKATKRISREIALDQRNNKRVYKRVDLDAEFNNLANELHKAFGGTQLNAGLDPTAAIILGKMAKNRIKVGVMKAEAIVDSIYTELVNRGMDVSLRDIRDAISGYGVTRKLSQDVIDIQMREAKRQMRLVSALEDAKRNQTPLKSGMQFDPVSNEVRELTRQVHEAMKEQGIDPRKTRTPEEQWRTAMDSVHTRLQNRIIDLNKEIVTRERISKSKGIKYDEEALALKEFKDGLQKISDGIFGKKTMSPEKRIQLAMEAAQKSYEKYINRIQNSDFSPTGKKPPSYTETPELQRMRDARDRVRKIYEKMRSENTTKKDPVIAKIEQTLKAKDKAIVELERRIQESDFSSMSKPSSTPVTQEIQAKQAQLDALRQEYAQLKKDSMPRKSPEEVALQQYMTRLERMTREYERKTAEGDFSRKPPKEVPYTPVSIEARHKLYTAKRNYEQARLMDRLARRTYVEKTIDVFREVINTPRTLVTSYDVSAPLRQGAFIFFAHPIRGAKVLPDMFKALLSDKERLRVDQEIISRKNYKDYESSGLYLAEHGKNLQKVEEIYQSRWAQKVPGVERSQAAYTTFLNKLRADSFDAMLENLTKGDGKGATLAEKQAISNYINVATGRGNIKMGGDILNTVFFAPRYLVSRFQYALGQPLWKTTNTARTRAIIAKEYAKTLIGGMVVIELGILAGGEFGTDQRSSDFGKLKFGDTRLDPLAGLSQISTFVARILTKTSVNAKGEEVVLRDDPGYYKVKDWMYEQGLSDESGPANKFRKHEYGKPDLGDVFFRFQRSKFSPFIGSTWDAIEGKDIVGNPVALSDLPKKLLIPISFGDIATVMREKGVAKGAVFSALALLGMGMNTYGPDIEPLPTVNSLIYPND